MWDIVLELLALQEVSVLAMFTDNSYNIPTLVLVPCTQSDELERVKQQGGTGDLIITQTVADATCEGLRILRPHSCSQFVSRTQMKCSQC